MEPLDQYKALREPFPAGMVGKLPRVTCKACSDARDKHCNSHGKKRCQECGNYITEAHIHLDYVGHAAVTDRLLQVDPSWTWDFKATNEDGSPVVVTAGLADPFAKVGLWITLTVANVTRPGFGEGKNFKEAIGDALRNAAMRFGVGLDLWAKEDLTATDSAEPNKATEPAPSPNRNSNGANGHEVASPEEQKKLDRLIGNLAKIDDDRDWAMIVEEYAQATFGHGREQLSPTELKQLVKELTGKLDSLDKAKLKELQTAGAA